MSAQHPTDKTTPADRRRDRERRTAELRARTLELRHAGATYAKIASAIGLSFKSAYKICKQAERLQRASAPK